MAKAFDVIRRNDAWKVLREKARGGCQINAIELIKNIYKGNRNVVRTNNEESKQGKAAFLSTSSRPQWHCMTLR